jgi:uncharacterized repeat protein (TIGR01451 family)
MLVSGLIVAPPFVAQGAPVVQQGTVTPRPTVGPTAAFTSPISGGPVDSDIDLALAVDEAEARPGDELRYRLQVANVAGQLATNVWLTCDLPQKVEIEEITTTYGKVQQYGRRVSVEMGHLEPGFESYFVTIRARIHSDVPAGAKLVHHANLTSDQAGGGEGSVLTTILGLGPEAAPTTAAAQMSPPKPTTERRSQGALPVTGGRSIPLWLVTGFVALIVVVALLSFRERIHLSR